MFEPVVNYFAEEYVTNNNSDISDCVYDTVIHNDFEKCNLEPLKTHLKINRKMYRKFNEYKRKAEKFELDYTDIMKDIEEMVLISDNMKEQYENLTSHVRRKRFLLDQIRQAPTRLENVAREYYLLRSQTFKGPRMNGGIFRSPDDKYLLGLMVIPYKVEYDKHNYPKLNITTEKTGFINKQNTEGDYNYGIGVIGKDFSADVENFVKVEFANLAENKHYFPLEDAEAPKETFINIPKKSNGLMYVILFILAVFLFRKLKK